VSAGCSCAACANETELHGWIVIPIPSAAWVQFDFRPGGTGINALISWSRSDPSLDEQHQNDQNLMRELGMPARLRFRHILLPGCSYDARWQGWTRELVGVESKSAPPYPEHWYVLTSEPDTSWAWVVDVWRERAFLDSGATAAEIIWHPERRESIVGLEHAVSPADEKRAWEGLKMLRDVRRGRTLGSGRMSEGNFRAAAESAVGRQNSIQAPLRSGVRNSE
jgi:hypothetical protein